MMHQSIAGRRGRITITQLALFALAAAVAQADVIIDGLLTHEIEVQAGTTNTGTILLRNPGQSSEEVKIYQTDYRSTADGHSFYGDPGTTPRSNAGWLSFSSMRFTVAAGESYPVRYSFDVPDDPMLSGTYFSVLMVEPIARTSAESADYDPDQTNIGVNTVTRYAVRMICHIQNTGTVLPEILDTQLSQEDDAVFLNLSIQNAGTLLFRVNPWAELYSEDGTLVDKFEGGRISIFPDSSRKIGIELSDVAEGSYLALVVLDCGGNNVFGANFNLQIE
jgi:hypothetical protein